MSDIRLRPYGGEQDAVVLAQIAQRVAEADQFDALSTLESLPSVDSIHSTFSDSEGRIAEASGVVVGSIRLTSWEEVDGTHLYLHLASIDPRVLGKGVGSTMLDWAEVRIRELAEAAERAMFGANAMSTQPAAVKFLEGNGYAPAFSLVEMELDDLQLLDEPGFDSTFHYREASESDVEKAWQLNEHAYQGRQFVSVSSGFDFDRFWQSNGTDFGLWTMLYCADELVAFVTSKLHGTYAEVTDVSVLPKFRRRGLARATLARNLNTLSTRGVHTVRLHTNGENLSGAKSLYESFGFRVLKSHIRYRKLIADNAS